MKPRLLFVVLSLITLTPLALTAQNTTDESGPLKILLVAGGCCHDYATQSRLLKHGIEDRISAVVTVEFNPSKTTDTTFKIYESPDWAKGYDLIVHDECSAAVTDKAYVERILAAHRDGIPAVNLHCAMHSYRWGEFRNPVETGADNAAWYEMIGIQSTAHGAQAPIDVEFVDAEHPITRGLVDWTTINEELYNNVRIFDGTIPLAKGSQLTPPNKKILQNDPSAKPQSSTAVVAWTNQYGPKKTKIFSTTLGHNNDTVGDPRYLDLVVRGIRWAVGK